jgi:hypothetical protein
LVKLVNEFLLFLGRGSFACREEAEALKKVKDFAQPARATPELATVHSRLAALGVQGCFLAGLRVDVDPGLKDADPESYKPLRVVIHEPDNCPAQGIRAKVNSEDVLERILGAHIFLLTLKIR